MANEHEMELFFPTQEVSDFRVNAVLECFMMFFGGAGCDSIDEADSHLGLESVRILHTGVKKQRFF